MFTEMIPRGMGIVHTRIRIYSTDLSRAEPLDLIVDTGSTVTWVPEEVATRLGLRPTDIMRFRTGDGREIERPVGDPHLEFEGYRRVVPIVFARPGDAHVLGVSAMEVLTVVVDPVTRTLRKTGEYLALAGA